MRCWCSANTARRAASSPAARRRRRARSASLRRASMTGGGRGLGAGPPPARGQAGEEGIAQLAAVGHLILEQRRRQARSFTEAHDAGNVLRPRPAAALLPRTQDEGRERASPPLVE